MLELKRACIAYWVQGRTETWTRSNAARWLQSLETVVRNNKQKLHTKINPTKSAPKKAKKNESSDEDDDFKYDSDPDYDTIDFSNWNTKKDVKKSDSTRNDNDGNNYNDDDNEESSDNESSEYSLNAIQEEIEREAMSAGMKSNRKRSREDNNDENNTASKEHMRHTNQQKVGTIARVSMWWCVGGVRDYWM